MIRSVLTGLMLGCIVTLFSMQFDPWVHKQLGDLFMRSFSAMFQCNVSGSVRTINFIAPEIIFDEFTVAECGDDPSWQWHARTYSMNFSWLNFIVKGAIELGVTIDDMQVRSAIKDNDLAIKPHIQAMFSAPNVAVACAVTRANIKQATTHFYDTSRDAHIAWRGTMKRFPSYSRTQITLKDGAVDFADQKIIEGMNGSVVIDSYDDGAATIQTDCGIDLVGLGDHPACRIRGSWQKKHGRFSLESADKSLHINPLVITQKNDQQWFECSARIPASYACYLVANKKISLQGECNFSCKGTLDAPAFIDAQCVFDGVKHISLPHEMSASGALHKREQEWFGSTTLRLPNQMVLEGELQWDDISNTGSATLKNSTSLSLAAYPYWRVLPKSLNLNFVGDSAAIKSNYTCKVSNELGKAPLLVVGDAQLNKSAHTYTCNARIHDFNFNCDGSTIFPYIKSLSYYYDKNNPAISLTHDETKKEFEGMIKIHAVRALIHHFLHYTVQGEGAFQFKTRYDADNLNTQFHLHEGTVRLPETFNFINGIDGSLAVNLTDRRITLENISCTLHTGAATIARGVVSLDQQGALSFAQVPICLSECLLNVKRDLFAVVSGVLSFSKQPDDIAYIKGNLLLDRSQLKENIFSEKFQKSLFQATDTMQTMQGMELGCDLTIETKDPIRIYTGFLDAHAQLNLAIKKNITQPEIQGTISLLSGSLEFPYKPLTITRGTVTFLKDQPLNPVIELVAKNGVKHHNITLHVGGSLRDHFVLLESTPPLTEEQIIGLLLAGSHEESLSALLPTLLVKNVTNIIFSADQTGVLDRYIKPWLKQINVHLVPKFGEQPGRGGIRGALEIDVNERWRALIEKNFSLTEDTRFELEYILSDDVRFRMIRDERCDIGGEVEMKWKF